MYFRPLPELGKADLIRFGIYYDRAENCWLWKGATNSHYGLFCISGRNYLVHRVAYYISTGIDPGSKLICHANSCVSKLCVNPGHLHLGTHRDNQLDRFEVSSLAGSKNPAARLTEELVIEIRERLKFETAKKLAVEYGVSYYTVWDIYTRRTWTHI